jgi:hypothetical protein
MDDLVVFVSEFAKDDDGQFIPCIAKRGERGYWKTDWRWGKDWELAKRLADERNERAGFTQKQAMEIVLSSMRHDEFRKE